VVGQLPRFGDLHPDSLTARALGEERFEGLKEAGTFTVRAQGSTVLLVQPALVFVWSLVAGQTSPDGGKRTAERMISGRKVKG